MQSEKDGEVTIQPYDEFPSHVTCPRCGKDTDYNLWNQGGCLYCPGLDKWQERQDKIDDWFLQDENNLYDMRDCPLIKDYEFLEYNDISVKFRCTWIETGETVVLTVQQVGQGIPHWKVITVCDEGGMKEMVRCRDEAHEPDFAGTWETMESWIERIKRKWASLPSVDAQMALGEDQIFQDMMAAIEQKLSYGRKMKNQESFRRYFLEPDVDEVGKMEPWKVPGTDRYTQFNKSYIEKVLDFWSDPDNVARAKILLCKIEDQVRGRTRYGVRGDIAQAPGHILAWSNGCMCWNVFRKQYQPGEELHLDANYLYVPGDYETLDRIRWLLPDLPLVHMDWTKTMDLSFKEERERERLR